MRHALRFAVIAFILFISSPGYAQTPTCPISVVQANPDTAICAGNCANLYVISSNTTIHDVLPTYTGSTIPWAPYPFVGSNIVSIPQDDYYGPVTNLPFSFCFFGQAHNAITIGSNGEVSFDITQALLYCPWSLASGALPASNTNATEDCIMGAYYDMYPILGGTISYATYGSAPCRVFVVSWSQVPEFSCNSSLGTQQVVMYESSNIIDIYVQSRPSCSSWNSDYSILGIENAAGSVFYTPAGYNPKTGAITNYAYRFTPNPAATPPTVTYTWTNQSTGAVVGNGAATQVCFPANQPPGPVSYICHAHFTAGCAQSDTYDTVTVNIGTGLVASFNATYNKNCVADTVFFTNTTVTPLDTCIWDFGDGSPTVMFTGATANSNTSHVYTAGGPYYIHMTAMTQGCHVTIIDTINVTFGSMTTNFSYLVHPGCLNDTVNFTNLSTITPGVIDSSYWDFGDGTTQYLTGPNAVAPTSHIYSSAGSYVVRLITMTYHCIDTMTQTVTINHNPVIAAFTVDRDSICRGTAVHYTNNSSGDGITSSWAFGDGATSTAINPVHTFTTSNLLTTVLTVTDSVGCVATASHNFEIIHIAVHMPFPDTMTCLTTDSVILVASTDAPSYFTNFIYNWSPAGNIGRTDTIMTSFFSGLDSTYVYHFTATATAPFGCIAEDSMVVHAHMPIHLLDVSTMATIDYGSSIRLHARGAYYYTWTPVNCLDNPNMGDPVATPLEPTYFTVIGFSEGGCVDSAHVQVNIRYPEHYVPSAFSPNGDGKNDIFRISNIKFHSLLEFRVFNRWGEEVFSTLDPNGGWDGTYNGNPCDIGTYHYLIRVVNAQGIELTDLGDVTLVR
ncbi:MAG: PKD domain-containing protein [Bacteroidota bacterium]